MAGTIVVDRIESDASYASTINVAGQITFSNTVNFGAYSGTAPVAGFYLPTTNNLTFTTASTERMRIDNAGNVGIGTSSPLSKLHVETAGPNYIYSRNSLAGAGIAGIICQNSSDTRGWQINGSNFDMQDHSAGVTRLRINSLGYVTQPYQSYAQLVYTDATGILRNNLVPWSGIRVNRNSAYNASTKLFTAPVAGIYFVSWTNRRYDGFTAGSGDQLNIYKNGSQYMQSYYAACVVGTVECAANDTIGFFYNNDSGAVYMKEAYASIWLLG
jgi:hypothetical protein